MAIIENKEIQIFWTFIQHESPFKFELSIDFQNRILNQHITNSNIFFTLIDGRGIGINFGTQITFNCPWIFLFLFFFLHFLKIYTQFKFEWWFMLNKGSENCYLFILWYGHLDLLTSMYRVSVWRWSSAMGR
jgi:hypothetical protein